MANYSSGRRVFRRRVLLAPHQPAARAAAGSPAVTPPLGWTSFGCGITESAVRQATDAMVSSGMWDAGYSYAVVDDCWSSADLVNWTDHGSYWYVPTTNRATGRMAIGVAVSDTPTGPFRDALGRPLEENGEIDPTVFTGGSGYLFNVNWWQFTA
jgi:hypothetical protein